MWVITYKTTFLWTFSAMCIWLDIVVTTVFLKSAKMTFVLQVSEIFTFSKPTNKSIPSIISVTRSMRWKLIYCWISVWMCYLLPMVYACAADLLTNAKHLLGQVEMGFSSVISNLDDCRIITLGLCWLDHTDLNKYLLLQEDTSCDIMFPRYS